jgi:hypothetical protein
MDDIQDDSKPSYYSYLVAEKKLGAENVNNFYN